MDNISPRISFIVPMYNVAPYLSACVESLLQQQVAKEIILVDDGSEDETLALALEFANRYEMIRVIHSQNGGASVARNRGISVARGEFIHFVDGDDYLTACDFNTLCDLANAHQVDLIRFNGVEHFVDGSTQNIRLVCKNATQETGVISTGAEYLRIMCLESVWRPAICWTLIRRDYLCNHHIRFVENNCVEDQLFYLQLLTASEQVKVLEFDWQVYQYRRHANSITQSYSEALFLDHFRMVAMIRDYQQQLGNLSSDLAAPIDNIVMKIYRNALSIFFAFDIPQRIKLAPYFTPTILRALKTYFNDLNQVIDAHFTIN